MDLLARTDYGLRMQHRHGDGTWADLEEHPAHHSPADHDVERDWAAGRLFVCKVCAEEVRVLEDDTSGLPRTEP